MADREFLLKVVGDVSNAQKSLGNLEKDVGGFKKSMGDTAKIIGGMFAAGAAIDFGKDLVKAASDQEQAIGAVDSVFAEYADKVHDFGKGTAESLGISRAEFEQLSTLTGALLKNAGVPLDEVTDSTIGLTEVGADLAAMYGGTVADAMAAINSGLKGEMDPLEKFGVSLKASAVDAEAAAMGYVDAEGKVTDYGRQMARVSLIMKQSADAQGTAAREAGTVAGQTQRLQAQFKDLQAELGTKLIPYVADFAGWLIKIVDFVSANQDWLVPLIAAIGGLVLGIKAWSIAQGILNTVLAANPIVIVALAIAALVAAIIWAYTESETFQKVVETVAQAVADAFGWMLDTIKAVWSWVSDNWPLLLAIITGPFGLAVWAILKFKDDIIAFFVAVPGALSTALKTVTDVLTYPFRKGFEQVKAMRDGLMDWVNKFPSLLNTAWNGLKDVITYPFKMAFNAIKNLWNSTVGGFGFDIPGWVPGVGGKGFKIPKMAAGGIVTRPTLALIGEAGPEAVVPLGAGGMFGGVQINVYALTANAEVGRRVWEALREYERTSGKSA